MDSNQVHLFTALQPEECVSRLSAAIEGERPQLLAIRGTRPVEGNVTESSLRLKSRLGNNHHKIILTASIKPKAGGTLIDGKLVHLAQRRLAWTLLFTLIALIGGLNLAREWHSLSLSSSVVALDWLSILVPAALLVVGLAIACFNKYMSDLEAELLKSFLIHTLDAQESTGKT